MSQVPAFGGTWTEQKLSRLRGYLKAYRDIFSTNPAAKYYRTVYLDAFAGAGSRVDDSAPRDRSAREFDLSADLDVRKYRKGSPRIALELPSPFDEYIFVDKDPRHAAGLAGLRTEFPHLANRIRAETAEANTFLRDWCTSTDWGRTRAVVFLDPFGMQVEWRTIEAIAATQGIDLWYLFPLGMGAVRLAQRRELPSGARAARITTSLGTDAWRQRWYGEAAQTELFGPPRTVRTENWQGIGEFVIERLGQVFEKVAPHSLVLRNRREFPLYLFCFAASSPKGAPTAVRIADHLLKG